MAVNSITAVDISAVSVTASSIQGYSVDYSGVTYAILDSANKTSNATLSNGDLTVVSSDANYSNVIATQGKSTGKWCFEVSVTADADQNCFVGLAGCSVLGKCLGTLDSSAAPA